jgi:hypothetical protein
VYSTRTALPTVVRAASGLNVRDVLPSAFVRDCGVTGLPLRLSFTPEVATVVAPSAINAVIGVAGLLPADPAEGEMAAT